MFNLTNFKRYRHEGILFNAVYGLYLFVFSGYVSEQVRRCFLEPEYSAPLLGTALALFFGLQIWALPKKMRIVNQAVLEAQEKPGTNLLFWIFYLLVIVLLGGINMHLFGIKIPKTGSEADMPLIFMPLLFVLVIVGIYQLFVILPQNKVQPEFNRPQKAELLYDFILFGFAALCQSATWGAILPDSIRLDQHPVMISINTFMAILIFLLFYLPLRMPYLVEEISQLHTNRDWFKFWLSLTLVVGPAIYVLYT